KINLLGKSNVLKKFDLETDKYITFQTGCGKRTNGNIRNWSIENYNKLVQLLHKKYPEYKLVQLGIENTDYIDETDLDLRGKTNFNDLLVLLKNAKLHIDIEAGCVHFRHFLCAKPSVVLFGPTNKDFFGYPENMNISANVCSGCEWVHNNWNNFCVKNDSKTAVCMCTITPNMVMKNIVEVLK
ncbi:MAG: glycosyltransferase family 9 protein, partial [Alphaproteobacteria bacterium]